MSNVLLKSGKVSKEELVRRTDLEEETIDEVLGILKAEFEEGA